MLSVHQLQERNLNMKSFTKIAVAMLVAAGAAYSVNAADNLLKSTAIGKETGARVFIHTPVAKEGGKITFENGKANVLVTDIKNQRPEWMQIYFDVQLDEGKTYKFMFKANSDKDGVITIHYLLGKAPYTSYAFKNIDIKAGENTYECEFTPKKVKDLYDSPRSLRFFLGKVPGSKLVLSDVSLEEVKK